MINKNFEKMSKMFEVEQLFLVGMHYGHKMTKSSHKMRPYIYTVRWGIAIIDLLKTLYLFNHALLKLHEVVQSGGKVLFVGTKGHCAQFVEQSANECGQFYINRRWIGGNLTNYSATLEKAISTLSKMEKDEDAGIVAKKVKKEQMKFFKKKEKLMDYIKGIRTLGNLPDIMIVINSTKEYVAISEARKMNIPVIALVDTDFKDPTMVDYIVPGNDEGHSSIQFFLHQCVEVINNAKTKIKVAG